MQIEGDYAHKHETFSGTATMPIFAGLQCIRSGYTDGLTAEDSLRREPSICTCYTRFT